MHRHLRKGLMTMGVGKMAQCSLIHQVYCQRRLALFLKESQVMWDFLEVKMIHQGESLGAFLCLVDPDIEHKELAEAAPRNQRLGGAQGLLDLGAGL